MRCAWMPSRQVTELKWLLQKGWLYSRPFRHEVFRLIKTAYPISEESTRNDFLEAVLQGPSEEGLENLDGNAVYAVYELLDLIATADPECSKAANAFLKAKQHCPDFVAKRSTEMMAISRQKAPMELKEILETEPA